MMSNFNYFTENNNCFLNSVDRNLNFERINYEHNKHIVNVAIHSKNPIAIIRSAFDARLLKHQFSHGIAGTLDLPSVFSQSNHMHVIFDEWRDYADFCRFCNIAPAILNDVTRPLSASSVEILEVGHDTTLMHNPCASLRWKGKELHNVTSIQLRENTVSSPSLMFQVNSNEMKFYHETDLRDVYSELKRVLSPFGIEFRSVLTD